MTTSTATDVRATVPLPARWRAGLRRRFAPATLVLAYHRVAPAAGRDANHLVVRSANFAAQLAWLCAHCRPLTLSQLLDYVRHPQRRKWTLDGGKPRVVITFDDGYADNLHHALPILENHGLGATIFATTGRIGSYAPFWWDALERIVFDGTPGDEWALPDGTRVAAAGDRMEVFRRIHRVLKPLDESERNATLNGLATQAGVSLSADADARAMSWDELRVWVARGMSVGGHTHTHPQLSALPSDRIQAELTHCKRELEQQLRTPVDTLAYPFGGRADYDIRCEQAARAAGFRCAFTVGAGNVRWARSRYALPRCAVGDWPLDEFVAQFEEWCR